MSTASFKKETPVRCFSPIFQTTILQNIDEKLLWSLYICIYVVKKGAFFREHGLYFTKSIQNTLKLQKIVFWIYAVTIPCMNLFPQLFKQSSLNTGRRARFLVMSMIVNIGLSRFYYQY